MSAESIVVLVIIAVLLGGYFFLMYFFPEWVGISGDKTKAVEREQHQEQNLNAKPLPPKDK